MSSNTFDDLWKVKKEDCVEITKIFRASKVKKEAKSYHDKRLIKRWYSFYRYMANVVSRIKSRQFDDYSKCVEHIITEIK